MPGGKPVAYRQASLPGIGCILGPVAPAAGSLRFQGRIPRVGRMILVTVGTHNQGFERLVGAMDELACELGERVVIQYGASRQVPVHAESFQWTSSEKMEQLTSQARVVVSHAAAGAIILALKMGKPLVVIPRKRDHQEHFDDHQQQLAAALAGAGMVVMVEEPTVQILRLAIEQAVQIEPLLAESPRLVQALQTRLAEWERKRATHCISL